MIRKRFYHVLKVAIVAAFFISGLFVAYPDSHANALSAPVAISEKKRQARPSTNMKKTSSFENPDFAFPETVEKDALPKLHEAVAQRKGIEALQAAIQLVVARSLVTNSSFRQNVAMLDSLASALPQPYSSLALLIEANYYKSLYRDNRWTYDQRTLPLDNYPEDPMEWSSQLFAQKILSLVESAFKDTSKAHVMPISDIAPILRDVSEAKLAGLSVEDFMVYNSMDVLGGFSMSGASEVIPFRGTGFKQALTPAEKCGQYRQKLIDELLNYRMTDPDIPALVVAVAQKADLLNGDERRQFLKGWVEKLIDSPECGRILNMYYQNTDTSTDLGARPVKELYATMQGWLDRFPATRFSKTIKGNLANLQRQSASVSIPQLAMPNSMMKGELKVCNLNDAYVLLYSVPRTLIKNNSSNNKLLVSKGRFIKAIKVETAGTVPFSGIGQFDLPALQPGYYVAVPSATPSLSPGWRKDVELWSLGLMNVSEIAFFTSDNRDENGSSRIYVVESATQKPVEGATVTIYDNSGRKKLIRRGTTDKNGVFISPKGFYNVEVSKGNSHIARSADFYFNENKEKPLPHASVLTDLSIYKPGDTVGFTLVGWTSLNHENKLLENKSSEVIMRDANWNPVDTLKISTDKWGRCSGKFVLPKDGLLGSYSIECRFADFPDAGSAGRCSFEVAEYKAPGFMVDIDSDSSASYTAGDIIKFNGVVKTYSGMPIADAQVAFNINWQPWWRWWNEGGTASYGGNVTTDGQGRFEIELPTENLKGSKYERGIYTLSVSATSSSGETQSAPDFRFALGAGLSVLPSIPEKVCIGGDSIKLNVPVYDMLGHPVARTVDFVMKDEATGKDVRSGSFTSPLLMFGNDMPSGRYKFRFNVEGDTLQTEALSVFFRISDTKPPYDTPLWIPEQQIICEPGEKTVDVRVGSSYPDSWILCEVSNEKGFLKREWLMANGMNENVKVNVPADNERVWVELSGMHDFDQKIATVTLIPKAQTKKMEVKATTFRDKIAAGGKESWKFTFLTDGKIQPGIPAMAVMSNKSLNALAPFSWDFSVGNRWWANRSRISSIGAGNINTRANFGKAIRYEGIANAVPSWNFYDYSLTSGGNFGRYRIRGLKSRAAATNGVATAESEEILNTVQVTSMTLYESAVKNESMDAATFDSVKEQKADGGEAEAPAAGAVTKDKVRPRPVEMPLAFFMPDLMADSEGNVAVEFTAPDFNTTWQLQIVGYTSDLLTAGLIKDAIASKPVMVQTNLPRYLRTGDKAQIAAMLFNNMPEEAKIYGEIEVFDPRTGKVVANHKADEELVDAGSSRRIAIDFKVPSDMAALAVRAYAYSGEYADGEQDIVAVLPSSTPVVESTQFYIQPGEKDFTLQLPKLREDANVTLKYCDNPLWECILALPSISRPDSKDVLTLMSSLYANSLALDVAGKYPSVREGLQRALAAKEAGDTSVLRSKLQKDANMKTVSLINTPWVNNAAAETERMENLSTLLDSKAGESATASIMKDVVSLQNADGGWSWCPKMESSLFMTRQALLHFGMMKRIGCLPAGHDKMISKAIDYCDKEVYDNYVKSERKFSSIDMLGYLYARSFFDRRTRQKGFNELESKALKSISQDWSKFSIFDKATAAILLSRSKGYERVSGVILESLRQLASKDKAKGWWYDNLRSGYDGMPKLMTTARVLQAYAEVEPKAPAVDAIRQWLVLQKETEDWGANSYTVEVIQSILSCGTDWTASPERPEIALDGRKLDYAGTEMLTGQLTLNIDPTEASGKKMTISGKSDGPAWGGVISQYVSPISDVKAEKSGNLKIEKKLYVVTDTEGGEVAKESPIKVGDKVRVTLTVTCGKDMNYVALIDNRAACLEPSEQISGYTAIDGLPLYREVRDTQTSFFIGFLPKGVNVISYDCHADRTGEYAIGIASIQSQYSPIESAHSAGASLEVTGN